MTKGDRSGLFIAERSDNGQLVRLEFNGRQFGSAQIELVQLYVLAELLDRVVRMERALLRLEHD